MIDVYVSLTQLFFLGVLCAGAHWILGRSEIARPVWSRARGALAALLACAGCSGFWLGMLLALIGLRPFCTGWLVADTIAGGVLGTFVTPVFEGVLLWGLDRSAIRDTGDDGADE
jgi:hypothetical protein